MTDFKFEQMNHVRGKKSQQQQQRSSSSSRVNNGNGSSNVGVDSDSSVADDPGPPFTVLKKADVELLVGGKPKTYSVVIKVLPTDDKVCLNLHFT